MSTQILKKTIGRRELVDFPELDLFEVEAKTDTGAYTSAIHCSDIEEKLLENGKKVICFDLLDESHPQYNHKKFQFEEYTTRDIKNSFGDKQERYIIKLKIKIYNKVYEAEFSLSDRSDMRYPVLLGRAFLQKRFIVDVAKKNLSYKYMKKLEEQNKNI